MRYRPRSKIRHAVTGQARKGVHSFQGWHVELTELHTVCGLWMDAEDCDEDLRATCVSCKRVVREDPMWQEAL
tara:strand:- start:1083 stop:1301 length:219 start_codon:yes stop_codon:yes gene_type:complete